jgi:hypothetical protein
LTAFLQASRPLPFERESFKVRPDDAIVFPGSEVVRFVQPLVTVAGWTTAALAAAALLAGWRKQPASVALLVAGLAAATAHATLLFSAVAAAGISRFLVSVFPAVVLSASLGAYWLFHKTFSRRSPARYD